MLLTVGHGTSSREQLGELLRSAGVAALVDIRTGPGSRRNPHLGRVELEQWLPCYDVGYRWERRLGGFRRLPVGGAEAAVDRALRNDSFRAYAAHMRTPEFQAAMADLVEQVGGERTTVMCSESVWWRCHRRLVADFASLVLGLDVAHLMPDGRLAPHRPTEGVRRTGDELVYDGGQPQLAGPE